MLHSSPHTHSKWETSGCIKHVTPQKEDDVRHGEVGLSFCMLWGFPHSSPTGNLKWSSSISCSQIEHMEGEGLQMQIKIKFFQNFDNWHSFLLSDRITGSPEIWVGLKCLASSMGFLMEQGLLLRVQGSEINHLGKSKSEHIRVCEMCFWRQSCYIAQAGLEFWFLLSQSSESWAY